VLANVRRSCALSTEDRRLLAEAAALLVCFWLAIYILPVPTLRRYLSRRGGQGSRVAAGPAVTAMQGAAVSSTRPAIERIAWSIAAVAGRLPGAMTCLVQALAAHSMLRSRGYASELRLGVRQPARSKSLEGHAWVVCEGVIVGEVENLSDYRVMCATRPS
jgi:hypothetical protein